MVFSCASELIIPSIKAGDRELRNPHVITTQIEHDSILRSVERLEERYGISAYYAPPDHHGVVHPETIEAAIGSSAIGTYLVSVMLMNNETGAENDIRTIGGICEEKGILLHTDCVQAAGCCDINVANLNCDFLSLSSHKIHGPKGVGALFVADPLRHLPFVKNGALIVGGRSQEFGLRGGTENVAGIVGFGKACEIMARHRHEIDIHCSTLKQEFWNVLNEELHNRGFDGIAHINGPAVIKHGKTINIRMDGVDGETLLLMLDHKGVCVASGSACTSHEVSPSHVLKAMGLSDDEARRSIRLSFSKYNTREEIAEAARLTAESVAVIRSWAS